MIDPFHDVRDKRMGELGPEQQERAAELWLRTNCSPRGSVSAYWWQHLQTLFRIIDRLRHEAEGLRARSTDRRTPIDFVQRVPDECDRILWRGDYYHLPLRAPVETTPKD